jgi:chitosanase
VSTAMPSSRSRRKRVVAYAAGILVIPGAALAYGLLPASAATAGPITGLAGKCVDIAAASSANGAAVQLYDCNGTAAQTWTVGNADNSIKALGKCLDVAAAGTANGAKVQLYDCNGTNAQKWTVSGGALVNTGSGKCLDVTNRSTANGARLQIWSCASGASNQTWILPGGGSTPPPPPPTTPPATPPTTPPGSGVGLDNPAKKDVAMQIVSAAENSSLDWRAQFGYIEDINDGRGYTGGIIGFCSGTHDMLDLVTRYVAKNPNSVLAPFLPALRAVDGTASHAGLGTPFVNAWKSAAANEAGFRNEQESERDRVYFNPSVRDGKADGLRALGQFAYYDAAVMHGYEGMRAIRNRAIARVKPPAQGGDEVAFLNAFLDERVIEMKKEEAHSDTTRVDTAQRVFLRNGNLDLNTPLSFKVYGQQFNIN